MSTLPIRGTFKSHYREKKEGVFQMKSYGLCQDMGHLDFEVRRPEFLWNCDFVEIAQGAIQICEDCLDLWRDLLDDFIKGDCQYSPENLGKQPMPQIPFIERYGDENYYLSLVALKRLRRKYFEEVRDSEGFCCIDCAREISLEAQREFGNS